MKIYSPQNTLLYETQVDDRSVRYRSIMSDDSLTLYFSMPGTVSVPLGSYVEFEGRRYTLFYPENFKKHNTRNFEYTLTLHGNRELLKRFKFKDMTPFRLKFPLTAKPVDFVTRIVQNMNLQDSGWEVGECVDAPEKLISFNHESCFDVLNRLAEEFNTEWEIDGKTIHLRKVEKFKDNPLALSYGKGNGFKSGTGRMNDGDKTPIGRLYVQGGDRNIDFSTYGSLSLLLPKSATLVYEGKTYRTDAAGMSITRDGNTNVAEGSYDGSDIYPNRIGTVSEVITVDAAKNFYDIKDSSIPAELNYRDCRIAGEKATIVFQSGILAGREFDIEQTEDELTGYIHAERRFKIVPQEQDGMIMPGGLYVPSPEDKYAVFNISLPADYIQKDADKSGASWDLFREAVKFFAEEEIHKFQFTGQLDGIWSKSRWLDIGGQIVPGGHVLFSDPQFLPEGEVIRIVAVKDYVNAPHKPEITLSNAPVSGSFTAELNKLGGNEVIIEKNRKEAKRYAQRQWRDMKETAEMLEKSISMLDFSNSINPLTVRTMQLIAGDESLQFRFVNSKTNPVKVDHDISFNPDTKQLTAATGIIQHMTLGINEISTSDRQQAYKFWDISSYTSPALSDAKTAYYLYLRCSKTGTAGTYKLSETPIGMEGEAGYYHFLVGILNSENAGDRSFAPVYGFTEILPGRITTDKIVSQSGNTYFDLVNDVIKGNITFLAGSSGLNNLSEWGGLIESVVQEYGISYSLEVQPSTWSITYPEWQPGEYVWTRIKTTRKDGSYYYSNTACIDGAGFNKLSIGVKNLIENGNFVRGSEWWTAIPNRMLESDISYIRIGYSTAWRKDGFNLEAGKEYTFSALVRNYNPLRYLRMTYASTEILISIPTGSWRRVSKTFTPTSNVGVLYVMMASHTSGGTIDITDVMIVEGNKSPEGFIPHENDKKSGENLLYNGNFEAGLTHWNYNQGEDPNWDYIANVQIITSGLPTNAVSGIKIKASALSQGVWQNFTTVKNLELNKPHVLSFWAKRGTTASGQQDVQLNCGHEATPSTLDLTTTWQYHVIRFIPTIHANISFYASRKGDVYITNIQLEQGLAPSRYKYHLFIEQAMSQDTHIAGGLILGSLIGARNQNGEVTSYMSGLTGNPTAFAAGVKNFAQTTETKTVDLRQDGSGHLASGAISWDASGNLLTNRLATRYLQVSTTTNHDFLLEPNVEIDFGSKTGSGYFYLPTSSNYNGVHIKLKFKTASTANMSDVWILKGNFMYRDSMLTDYMLHRIIYTELELIGIWDSSESKLYWKIQYEDRVVGTGFLRDGVYYVYKVPEMVKAGDVLFAGKVVNGTMHLTAKNIRANVTLGTFGTNAYTFNNIAFERVNANGTTSSFSTTDEDIAVEIYPHHGNTATSYVVLGQIRVFIREIHLKTVKNEFNQNIDINVLANPALNDFSFIVKAVRNFHQFFNID